MMGLNGRYSTQVVMLAIAGLAWISILGHYTRVRLVHFDTRLLGY